MQCPNDQKDHPTLRQKRAKEVGQPQKGSSWESPGQPPTLVGTKTSGEVLGGANFNLRGEYVPAAGWYTWQGESNAEESSRT